MTNQMHKKINVGLVGATGMVGQTFLKILEERKFPIHYLKAFASDQSEGKKITLNSKEYTIQSLKTSCFDGLDLVFFSSGDEISKEWAPQAVKSGAWVIDNSAAFRMDPSIPLVVPEVNAELIHSSLANSPNTKDEKKSPKIIANPNCTTIQLMVVLKPLLDAFGLDEIRLCSYQAVSGAGQVAYDELLTQTKASFYKEKIETQALPHQIAYNCIPQIGSINELGYSTEEMKVINETQKILKSPDLRVSAFTVRVPVLNAHAEAVWVTLDKVVEKEELISVLYKAPGLKIEDEPSCSTYPMQYKVSGKNDVYVGRIHRDLNNPKIWLMWIVADNIRKGAALNGIQIAERIFDLR